MTTTAIQTVKGVTFAKSLGNIYFVPPVANGLVAAFEFGGSLAASLKNWAPGHAAGVFTGTPVLTDGGLTLNNTAYIDTDALETTSYTVLSVARKSATSLALASTLSGSTTTTPYAQVTFRAISPVRYGANAKTTPATAEISFGYDFPVGDTGFELFAAVCDSTAATQTLFMPRFGTVGGGNPRSVANAGPRDAPTATWRIGAVKVTSGLYPGSTEHACMLIFNRALTEAEIRTNYAYLKARLAVAGISI